MDAATATEVAPVGQKQEAEPSGSVADPKPSADAGKTGIDESTKKKETKAERKARKKETQAKLKAIKDEINKEADEALQGAFPVRIAELDALLKQLPTLLKDINKPAQEIKVNILDEESSSSNAEGQSSAAAEPPQKRRKLNDSSGVPQPSAGVEVWRKKAPRTDAELARIKSHVGCHPQIVNVTNQLKKRLMQMIKLVSMLKISISLRIPKMEDGNNFGVGVQEECLGELGSAEDVAFAYYDKLTKYFQLRAKLVSKILKWPYVEDYRDAVRELDEKQGVTLKTTTQELRHTYLVLWDLITKNMTKLKNPRNHSGAPSFIY